MDLSNLQNIKKLLQKHQNNAKKFLGQNFLINQTALSAITSAADLSPEDHILEIGPGLGVLTKKLAQTAKKVTSLEIDSTLFPILEETLADYPNVEIIHTDALRWDYPHATPYKIIANIPYFITSPLITHFLTQKHQPTSISLLIQKEVAKKITTLTPDMTYLSLFVALYAKSHYILDIPSDHFFPAPKVDSAIIHLIPHHQYNQETIDAIIKLAKPAFRQRRKKLSNTLSFIKDRLIELELADKRPQHLTIEEWKTIASQ